MPRSIILLTIFIIIFSCKSQTKKNMPEDHQYTNELINETSPYLLQHAHNPVNWYAWNKETLDLAKKENKLLLISIGYSACHWCHVMEHESFEDSTVAAIMNEHFINVKVDREERPDVDQIYMNAVQLLTGRGGWPLNCVALPDGRPIWGGTYFPKDNWINALNQLAELYKNEPEKAEEYASKLTEGIKQSDLISFNTEKASFTKSELESAIKNWKQFMDFKNGGRLGAPKFPMPNNFLFLLRYAVQTNNSEVLDYVNTTLTQMAYGGIYDHIGGGFARYSVDGHWHIPHFEKMLYDNAQLITLYSNAYLATKNSLYKQVVYETTQFIERELYNEIGAFYSSLDADSKTKTGELEEGVYYIWNKEELQNILKDDFELFSKYYNVNSYGKWEKDTYHLIRKISDKKYSEKYNISEKELQEKVTHWKKVLLKEREKRNKPRLDDKTLTSWNALMLKAYTKAYTVFDDDHFLKMALKNGHFIINKQIKEDGGLYRNYKNGKSTIEAYLEDYATVIDAFINLYEATLDENWLQTAKQLTDYSFDHFYDDKSKMFFFTSDKDTDLITRKIEVDDNVIPSSNSIMANNLFKLAHYYENKNYSNNAKIMLNNVKNKSIEYGGGASNWLNLYANYIGDFYEIAIVGGNANDKLKEFNQNYIPNKIIVGSTKESRLPLLQFKYTKNETTIFVCVDGACQLPVNETKEALKQIKIEL
ncbi:MAG: thioredoxin domain-containing protein [Flavobacteriaceae bacterium]|nr:thioredoxin domain-containing protein [Flavobacteriaceae bacterium]